MGLPENNNKSKAEYTNTQQDFLAAGFVLPKATKSLSLFSYFSSNSSMLTILGEHMQ
jgi:hypothetical protein